jgi:hypothetical protein
MTLLDNDAKVTSALTQYQPASDRPPGSLVPTTPDPPPAGITSEVRNRLWMDLDEQLGQLGMGAQERTPLVRLMAPMLEKVLSQTIIREMPNIQALRAAAQATAQAMVEDYPAAARALPSITGTPYEQEVAPMAMAPSGGDQGPMPWLMTGQVTLLVSPFQTFAEVQRFIRDLGKVPRVYEVRPKRFSSGRLYAVLNTEYADSAALADALVTELITYRPRRRSVQTNLVELVLVAATPAASESGDSAEQA